MKEEKTFELQCIGGPYYDCCSVYTVAFHGDWTVEDFITAVLKQHPDEWGEFNIGPINHYGVETYRVNYNNGEVKISIPIKYKNGELKKSIPDEIAHKNIKMASAHGGWSNIDYLINI